MSNAAHANFERIRPEEPAGNGQADESMFEDFTPLWQADPPENYPAEYLPPVIRDAVFAYQEYGQQPVPLVASSALASVSVAGQGLINVRIDSKLSMPLTLFVALVACSGERKSSCDDEFARPLREWERRQRDELGQEIQQCETAAEMYEAERKALFNQLTRSNLAPEDKAATREQIHHLDENKPRRIVPRRIFYEDVNEASLSVALAEGWPSAALWSDEAGLIIGSRGMADENVLRFLTLLNRLWDGKNSTRRDRMTTKSSDILGRRLTVSLMMQPTVFATLTQNMHTRGTGYLARCLLCEPESTIGTREYREPPERMPELERFSFRIAELLDFRLPAVGENLELCPPDIPLSAEAKEIWEDYYNTTERQLGDGGDLEEIKDFASKSAANAARLAGLFEIFENGVPETISRQNMVRGAMIAEWYLGEAKRLLQLRGVSPRHANAMKVWRALMRKHEATGRLSLKTRDALGQNITPKFLRLKEEWGPLVQLLQAHGYCVLERGTIHLNPEAVEHG